MLLERNAWGLLRAFRAASVFGITAPEPVIDGVAVITRLRTERDRFVAGMLKSINEIPARIRQTARAHFIDATKLALDTGTQVSAKAIVIATGSRPHVPDMFRKLKDRVLTNEAIFDLHDLPKSVAVIGAGALGLELAQARVRLGVETAVFDQGDHIAGLRDEYVALSSSASCRSILALLYPSRVMARKPSSAGPAGRA